ncbi:MAG TPA: sigma-70 family RNA polymerase sigma factor [Nannocystaceae bacterium]|nr:sigma-70 family RNA polymerase sigma factor [Nannocystaceae bacterium]
MPGPSDAVLLDAWRAGDRSAGEALIGRHYRGVLRFFELNASWAADDLAQRTFLACIERAAEVRDAAAFRPYLLGIARRQLARHLRQLAQSDALSRFDAAPAAVESTRMSTLVARNREQMLVLRALASLPRCTQSLLILYYWEGVRTPELALAFDVTASTIRSRLERARDLLRTRMESFQSRRSGALPSCDDETLQQLLGSVVASTVTSPPSTVGARR